MAANFCSASRQSRPGRSRSHRITVIRIFFSRSSASSQELVQTKSNWPRAENAGRESLSLRALKAGARGYLLKDSHESDLINAILAVHEGKAFFSPAISKMLVEAYMLQQQQRRSEDSYELLTSREREVLQLLAEGKSNKDVAGMLNLSLHTVETNR